MKNYKLLFLAILSCFAISCSQDSLEQNPTNDSDVRLASDQFDNSYLGVYKGLFSTNDGLIRGSVVMTLLPSNEAVAQLTLSSGEIIELKSSRVKLTLDNSVENLNFSSAGLSNINVTLNFSVNGDGANPVISNVSFDNKQSDILIAKNLSRVPLTPITGTFDCTDCASQGIGFPNGRTWNVMAIGAGNNQNFAVQVAYGGRIYTSPAANNTQNGCVDVVGFSVCGVAGSIRILGYDVTWNGTHVYPASDALTCSSVNGSWSAPLYGPGVNGTFQSDSNCDNPTLANDVCGNATSINVGGTATGSTASATNGDTPDFCDDDLWGSADGAGVWYTFTSPEDAVIQVDTNGSALDTQMRLFSGTCGALECVDNNDDDGAGLQSLIVFDASANVTYYVFIGGYNTSVGNYVLNVTELVPPPSLTCGDFLIDNGGNGNYANNSFDTYTIDAGVGNTISLEFSEFNTENQWDFLQVYDGADSSAPEITMSVGGRTILNYGEEEHGFTGTDVNSLLNDSVVSTGQFMTLVFYSDVINNRSGFLAEVVCLSNRASFGKQKNSLNYSPMSGSSSNRVEKTQVNTPSKQVKTAEYYGSQQ